MTNTDEYAAKDDKEARKQIRRDRISGRQGGADALIEGKSSPKDAVKKYSNDEQLSESIERLGDVQARAAAKITEARVRSVQREAKRRDDEEEDNDKRRMLLEQFKDARQDDEVACGWKRCMAADDVQGLSKMLDKQQQVCEAALSKLERIGSELGSELREKEHEYVIALKRNRQEVELLQRCIENEHVMLKEAFEKELRRIEESLIVDRNRILDANKHELDSLVKNRKDAETASLEGQRQVIDEHRNGIAASELKGEREREDLKKKLESEVRRLEIELEDTRARHQFDTEKLEYNVRVLTELSENEEAVKKQKRRIMKGKEELNRELEDKHRARSEGIRKNELIEADCERIEKQSSGLREKFERFKVSDDEKYRAVLGMHRDDLRRLQGELKRSQDFIFGGAIGCCETAEQSYTSDVTWPGDVKSNKTNECKVDPDEFGLEREDDNHNSQSFDKSDEWNQAEELMSDYRNVLERRESLNTEVAMMERKNVELERELKSKLKEKVNEELAFPPSTMISMEDAKK